jgi:hypothetical protein
MANRNTLSINKLEMFSQWLKLNDWQLQETKGCYEVLRVIKKGRKFPLIVYCRNSSNNGKELKHFSLLDRDVGIIRAFLRQTKGGGDYVND